MMRAGSDKRMKKRLLLAGGMLLCSVIVLFVYHIKQNGSLQEVRIPDDSMFVDAPMVDENDKLTVLFTYNDHFEPVEAQGVSYQTIQWDLIVAPRDGAAVDDFYCTLLLDDWILQRSSSPSWNYMGVGKGYVRDMPEDSRAFHSTMEKMVLLSLTDDPQYGEALERPVKLMLAYDDREYYYWVTPSRADGSS